MLLLPLGAKILCCNRNNLNINFLSTLLLLKLFYLLLWFSNSALLQKHETLLVGMAKLKLRVLENTAKICEACNPSVLKITKQFFGHQLLMSTGILNKTLK